jgi:hypothetical protein
MKCKECEGSVFGNASMFMPGIFEVCGHYRNTWSCELCYRLYVLDMEGEIVVFVDDEGHTYHMVGGSVKRDCCE